MTDKENTRTFSMVDFPKQLGSTDIFTNIFTQEKYWFWKMNPKYKYLSMFLLKSSILNF